MYIQLPVVVVFPSLPHFPLQPAPEIFLRRPCLACHYRPVAKVSLRRPLVASLRTSQFLLGRRASLPFRLRANQPGSPRVPVLARQLLRGQKDSADHRRCHRLRELLRELLCRVPQGRLLVLGRAGKKAISISFYGYFHCAFLSYT